MLVKDLLRTGLSPLFDPRTMPSAGTQDAVDAFVRGYAVYAQGALAGGALPSPLVWQAQGGDYLTALDSTLRAMWMSVAWVGPGLVGTTAVVPPLQPYLTGLASTMLGVTDVDSGLSLIVEAIHTYTLGITVSVVPPSGTPAIVPLT